MKYYLIAGEASGDLHGSKLIKEIKKIDSKAEFRCWGGDLIKKESGNELVKHYKTYSFMGFLEVLLNIITVAKNYFFCRKDILKYNPDAIIYIDFPGFNLPIAGWAKKNNFINHFYISPQIWAWKEKRIKKIRKFIDKMYVILPFEKDYYEKRGVEVDYVGHPLLDEITKSGSYNFKKDKIIALLPGSRDQEIDKILPKMLSVVKYFKEFKFVICAAPSQEKSKFDKYLKKINSEKIEIVFDQTYSILKKSSAALVASGTATLEAALLNVPQVVCYKSSWISYRIGKYLIKNLKFISLVNLILNKEAVKELIQNDLNEKNLVKNVRLILEKKGQDKIHNSYKELRNKLGNFGASKKTANLIVNYFENS
ncbi:MAG: lipid-A-disaccharide synthase [Bacteroidetes bacterium MED-G13]|nr:MAG: lipid-A-disaccharide synthase [Bacteroidetes bacterium MED-G13]